MYIGILKFCWRINATILMHLQSSDLKSKSDGWKICGYIWQELHGACFRARKMSGRSRTAHLACKHTEHTLMQVHDGVVSSLVAVHHGVGVQSHNQEVPLGASFLQEVKVAHVKQVESPCHIHYAVFRLKIVKMPCLNGTK